MSAAPMDYSLIAQTALARANDLLGQWFPAGKWRGREFVIGALDGRPGESLSINTQTGQWADFATDDRGGDLISLYAATHRLPQHEAAKQLSDILGGVIQSPPPRTAQVVPMQARTEWDAILPIPDNAPPPPNAHPVHGVPSHVAKYRDADGSLLCLVYRCEPEQVRKQIVPLTYCRHEDGREQWRWQSMPKPRSLYGVELLKAFPNARVLLVEGEVKCDLCQTELPDQMVALSWMGGAQAWKHVAWQQLAGREVVIWPDADDVGKAAAEKISEQLSHHKCGVRVLTPPKDVPEGWDIADAMRQGWTRERIIAFIDKPAPAGGEEWRVIVPSLLRSRDVPERRWIVPNWLPKRQVTLNYADGGIGKTLLAMQLMAATALSKPWCGLAVEPCASLGLFSEDDSDELHIRLDGIRQFYKADFADMDDMALVDGTGQDNMLVEWDGTSLVHTKRFIQLREHALDIRAKLVVIDTAATTFGGNEIDRKQVTQFVGHFLTRLAQDIDGSVLLNAHPSVSGIASGDLRSGSTAWNNSCRSRWAMTRPEGEDGKPKLDSMERILTRRKSNGAAAGEVLSMEWRDGVFTTKSLAAGVGSNRKDACEAAFIEALRVSPRPVSDNKQAPNYAPKAFYMTPQARDFNQAELGEAMRNLMSRGVIHVTEYKQNYRVCYQISLNEGNGYDR